MKQIINKRINAVFLVSIAILYLAFLALDIFFLPRSIESRYLKFASITLCFMLATSLYRDSADKKDSGLVVVAMIFTMLADVFLLFIGAKITGVFFFCLVQLTYLWRYNKRFFTAGLVCVAAAIAVHALASFQPLYVIAGLYAALIGICFLSTFRTDLPKFNVTCVRIGMVFFILCDIHVALYNQLSSSSDYYRFVAVAMWLFYLPAQLFLSLSAAHLRFDKTDCF
ncbi:MAG: hypothetical protein FWE07_06915 [Turicibacter sp.]|nr:hypothetical protein [Turicibacter sp.]